METTECKWSYTKDGKHREFILPGPFSKADGKKVCQDCCRFLGWHNENKPLEAPPASFEPGAVERDCIHLLEAGNLNDWEKKFCADIARKHAWTEKQHAAFKRIRDKYLKEGKKNESTSTVPNPDFNDLADVPF